MSDLEEFKFPDEQEAEAKEATAQDSESEFEVQVESDKPEDDQGRKPLSKRTVKELESDDLSEYSENVKKRLSQMKRVWHDERRAKEAAAREKEEALKFAQTQMEENRRLKQRLGVGEKAFISEVTKAATNELGVAKDKLKFAYESGDAEKIAEAQEAMTDAKLRLREYERFKPSIQDKESDIESDQQAQAPRSAPAPTIDPKAEAWKERNTWFGVDEEMTALALGLHEKLVRAGIDPRTDEYYAKVDQTMRKRFPESFEDDAEQTTEAPQKEEKPRAKAANVVAPVTRSTAPRQIRLTSSQVAIAKRLGLSNEQYARELMKLEAN